MPVAILEKPTSELEINKPLEKLLLLGSRRIGSNYLYLLVLV